jgi:hypothetical protein
VLIAVRTAPVVMLVSVIAAAGKEAPVASLKWPVISPNVWP